MPFRSVRLTDFNTDRMPGAPWDVELLCRDSRGVYVLPFPGRRIDGAWVNSRTSETLEFEVLGWRLWEDRFKDDLKLARSPRLAANRDAEPADSPNDPGQARRTRSAVETD